MEPIYVQDFEITDHAVDRYGRLKPSLILFLAQEAAGHHCKELSVDYDTLARRRLFWAVTRHRVQVSRLPGLGERIRIETWPLPTTRVAYPRATEGFDADGNSLFRLLSVWVIMDMTTRAMILPGKSGVEVAGTCFGTELKAPIGLPAAPFDRHTSRTVCFSDLDINGHMNNTRYLDWLCDLLPAAYHRDHPMKAVTICYMHEAREGQNLLLSWTGGDVLRLDGSVPETDAHNGHTRLFSAQAEF